MKHVFIINPNAGKSDISKYLTTEIAKLKNVEYEILLTEYPGHAKLLSKEVANNSKENNQNVRIYACGGDGTLNEVMEGAYGCENVEIGCLPYGTGNDYVKNFGTAEDFKNLRNLVDGTSIDVDILETEEGISAGICSMGFDAKVGYNTRHYKKLPLCHGKMAYNLAVVESILQPIGTKLKITVDDKVFEGEYLMVCLANGTTYGGGFKSAPEASVCDGLIDVIIVKKVSRFYIAKIISKYSTGTYQENCEVLPEFQHVITYLRGKKVRVEGPKGFVTNLDGECKVQKLVDVKIREKATKFILPQGVKYRKK